MSSLQGTFSIAPGTMVAVRCASERNILHLHTADGPPVIGSDATLALLGCDITTFASPQVALLPTSSVTEIFGNENGAVVHMIDTTLLHNWSVCAHSSFRCVECTLLGADASGSLVPCLLYHELRKYVKQSDMVVKSVYLNG